MTLVNCAVDGNTAAGDGGGIGTSGTGSATILITDSTFSNNATTASNARGGAIYLAGTNTFEADGCTFHANASAGSGGGIRIRLGNQQVKVHDCTFTGNSASSAAGAIDIDPGAGSTFEIISSSFIANIMPGPGAPAIRVGSGGESVLIEDCLFEENSSVNGYGAVAVHSTSDAGTPTIVRHCNFRNNIGGSAHSTNGGGAIAVINSGSGHRIEHCLFEGNHSAGYGGGVNLYWNDATVTHCIFINNTAGINGGGVRTFQGPTQRIYNSLFVGNHAVNAGGGMYLNRATARNCTVVGNGGNGGAEGGGGIHVTTAGTGGANSIHNCIVQNNTGGQIVVVATGTTISHTNAAIAGGFIDGGGNINEDPLFVDPDIGNFRLDEKSPSIDTGSNVHVPLELTVDLDGNPRIVDATNLGEAVVDMGAYEFPIKTPKPDCPADLTGNGSVGVPDLLVLLAAWGPCDDPFDCPADLTGNGSVGVPDLLVLLAAWGPCP